MKTIPIQLLNSSTRALFLKATRQDGQIYGFSTTDESLVIDDVAYGKGMDISTFQLSADLSFNNGEVSFLPDEEIVFKADLMTGIWNNFSYEVFEADWTDPSYKNPITAGTSGEVSHKDEKYVVELRGLKQALANTQGQLTSMTCRARFADYPAPFKYNVRCRLDPADYTDSSSVISSPNRQSVTAGLFNPDQWFKYGYFTATSGENGGQSRQVRSFVAGLFIFDRPFDYDFAPGDTFDALAGCDKTLETCKTKFNNILNMQAEPHTPGIDAMSNASYGSLTRITPTAKR